MGAIGDEVRRHHSSFNEALEAQIARLEAAPFSASELDSLVARLNDDLLPHIAGEERHLYPVVDELIRVHARPTTPMSIDHQRMEEYIHQLEQIAEELPALAPEQRQEAGARALRLARELRGLVRVHTEKEERVFLPLVEAHLTPAEQVRLLRQMHHSYRDSED